MAYYLSLLLQFGRVFLVTFLLLCFIVFSPLPVFLFFFFLLLAGFWLASRNRGHVSVTFSLDITATYFLSSRLDTAATFARRLHLPADAFTGDAARDAVLAALPGLHIINDASTVRTARHVLSYCNDSVPRCLNDRTGVNDWILAVQYNFYVDELPPVNEFYVGPSPPDNSEEDYVDVEVDDGALDNDGIGFSRLSEESIAGLEKEKTVKALTCAVCLIEAPIGSELIRLPCSHRYHAECIVPWLERSKFCPYCRFELH